MHMLDVVKIPHARFSPFLWMISLLGGGLLEPIQALEEVSCDQEPPAVRQLMLQEAWRLDPEDDQAPLVGWIDARGVVASEGRVYMLDQQLCHVLVFDAATGDHLDTIMGQGDGPGEIRNPAGMFLLADGGLAVQHGYPSRLELVEGDGTPRRRWQIRVNTWLNRVQETPDGWFCVYTQSIPSDDPGVFSSQFHAALHDQDGERLFDFHVEPMSSIQARGGVEDEIEDHVGWYTAAFMPDGLVVHAPRRDEYRLEWHDRDGQLVRVVTREFKAHRRTEAELAEQKYRS